MFIETDLFERFQRRKPHHTLEQGFYRDEAVFKHDLARVWRRSWLFSGHGCEIREPGSFFTLTLGDDSIIVCRDQSGVVRAFHNTCRHRGSRIVAVERGRVKRFVCPYHNWAYDTEGRLASALYMGDDFDPDCHGLVPVHVAMLCDFVYICLAQEPPPFDDACAAIAPHLAPYQPERTRVCHRDEYLVRANWKLVVENNRECYHCRVAHPEFMKANYDLGINDDPRGEGAYTEALTQQCALWRERGLPTEPVNFPNGAWYRVARMPMKPGFVTETLSGQPVAPILGGLRDAHCGSLRIVNLPNAWMHANCDYLMSTRLTPVDPLTTRITVRFLVHEDAREGVDYQRDDVTAVWRATSEQDWQLCENNQLGVNSSVYTPGPYSPLAENAVEHFIGWYQKQLLGEEAALGR